MPVCRYPTVVSALTTVSPESCSTRRSTPCVLGCCGPMLTVIVSLRSSGMLRFARIDDVERLRFAGSCCRGALDRRRLDQLADHVQERAMHFLHPRGVLVGHVDVNLGGGADPSAVAAGQRDRLQPALAGALQRGGH